MTIEPRLTRQQAIELILSIGNPKRMFRDGIWQQGSETIFSTFAAGQLVDALVQMGAVQLKDETK